MRTYLFRYEIGQVEGLIRVDARCPKLAQRMARLKAERASEGRPFTVWALN